MGNLIGYFPQNGINLYFHPDVTPHPLENPTHDPSLGFPNGRKERTIKMTREEMESMKIPLKDRDYCVDPLLNFRSCRIRKFPFVVLCEHEKHEYLHCQHHDYILRMKEYEREKRLRIREKKAQGEA